MHVNSVEIFLDKTDFAQPICSLWDQAIEYHTPYTFPLIYCVQLFIVKKVYMCVCLLKKDFNVDIKSK